MRKLLVAAALAAIVPATAYAADTAPATEATARLSLDTPVETIVADAAGKAVLDADLPGVTTHEHYDMFKSMTLRQLATMAPDKLTAELLAKVEADLAKVK
jgi:uncharacterized protein involved in exopolysaccharide biosynthesis